MSKRKIEALYDEADSLRNEGELEAAIGLFRKVLEHDPAHLHSWNDLGIALHDQGDAEAAIKAYNKALKINPGYLQSLNNLGNALQDAGYWDKALKTYDKALKIDADYVDANYNKAVALQEQGKVPEAAQAFRRVLELDPEHATARHMAAALTGQTTEAPPDEYVRDLFDDYASSFEEMLTGELGYRTPDLLREIFDQHVEAVPGSLDVLDLGCGTGLMGTALDDLTALLVGVDLSPGMMAEAEAKGIYDELVESDVVGYMKRARRQFDLITAADVLVYLGRLEEFIAAAARRLAPEGFLLISTEMNQEADFTLSVSGRYSHGRSYVEGLIAGAGLELLSTQKVVLREDSGIPVQGLCYLAYKEAAGD